MADLSELPDIALSVMNPWAFLIVNGFKPLENRDWRPTNPGLRFRGPVAIHTGEKLDRDAASDVIDGYHPVTGIEMEFGFSGKFQTGGIVGVAEIVDVVTRSDSDWFVGPYGLVIANARPVPFIRCKGALGFFKWKERVW